MPIADNFIVINELPARMLKRKPTPARSIVTDARAAVLAFLGEMAPEIDSEIMPFKLWCVSYDTMRAEKGWPPLSEKSLSQTMQVVGCRRQQVEARRKGKGRYIAFSIPEAMAA